MNGSCCCGSIQFEIVGEPSMMATCHCSRCRKVGASTFIFIKREQLVWLRGKDQVERYEPVAPYRYARCFCKMCGTALGEIMSDENSFPIAANVLDADPVVRNRFHEFVAEKPDWYQICDGAKQFEGHPVPS